MLQSVQVSSQPVRQVVDIAIEEAFGLDIAARQIAIMIATIFNYLMGKNVFSHLISMYYGFKLSL